MLFRPRLRQRPRRGRTLGRRARFTPLDGTLPREVRSGLRTACLSGFSRNGKLKRSESTSAVDLPSRWRTPKAPSAGPGIGTTSFCFNHGTDRHSTGSPPQEVLQCRQLCSSRRAVTQAMVGLHFCPTAGTFFISPARNDSPEQLDTLYLGSLSSPARTLLVQGSSNAQYAKGHISFSRQGTLLAHPFDVDRQELKGEPVALTDGVQSLRSGSATAPFSVCDAGLLVYQSGTSVTPVAVHVGGPEAE